jgi:hypothetical protein
MRFLAGLALSCTLVACADDETAARSDDATNAVVTSSTPEPAGSNCPYGGTRVEVGLDKNGNGVLDPWEVQSTFYVCDANPLGTIHEGSLYITSAADMAAAQDVTGVIGDLVITPVSQLDVSLPNLAFVSGNVSDCGPVAPALMTVALPALQTIGGGLQLMCGNTRTFSAGALTQIGDTVMLSDVLLDAFSAPALATLGGAVIVSNTQLAELSVPAPGLLDQGKFEVTGNANLDECALYDMLGTFRAHGWHGDPTISGNIACADASHFCPIVPVGADATSWRECFALQEFAGARTECQGFGKGWDLAYLTSYDDETAVGQLSFDARYWIGYQQMAVGAPYSWVQAPSASTFAPQAGDGAFWDSGEPTGDGTPDGVELFAPTPGNEVANDLNLESVGRQPLCRYLAP